MPRLKMQPRPFWAEEKDGLKEKYLRELQTKGSRPGDALVFSGLDNTGRPTFHRVPHRFPAGGRP